MGGYSYDAILHELGHVLRLTHPWSDLGHPAHFPGVVKQSDYGTHSYNFALYTVMSYHYLDGRVLRDGVVHLRNWAGPDRQLDNGFMGTPMAFDVAAVQALYGANPATGKGDSFYDLGKNSYFSCIWDTGGSDWIRYSGNLDCAIDLRAATLNARDHAGGFLSYFEGAGPIDPEIGPYGRNIFKGFTIAPGVVIEKAIGGSGHDFITGNEGANILAGRGGDDTIYGGGGADIFVGGTGDDTFYLKGGVLGAIREKAGQGFDILHFDIRDFQSLDGLEHYVYEGNARLQLVIKHEASYELGDRGSSVYFHTTNSHLLGDGHIQCGRGADIIHFRSMTELDFDDRIGGFRTGVDKIDASSIPIGRKFQTVAAANAFLSQEFASKPAAVDIAIRSQSGIDYAHARGYQTGVDEEGDPIWMYQSEWFAGLHAAGGGSIQDYIL